MDDIFSLMKSSTSFPFNAFPGTSLILPVALDMCQITTSELADLELEPSWYFSHEPIIVLLISLFLNVNYSLNCLVSSSSPAAPAVTEIVACIYQQVFSACQALLQVLSMCELITSPIRGGETNLPLFSVSWSHSPRSGD